jgi:nucleoredoxin
MKAVALTIAAALFVAIQPVSANDAQAQSHKEHFPDGIVDIKGEAVSLDTLKGKVVGLYFSAHWCGPCRAFTPSLVKYREKYKDNFEVVFVSSDRSAKDQKKYMTEAGMEWPTMEFRSSAANALKKRYNVTGIPKLVLLGTDGKTLSTDGRGLVSQKLDMAKIATGKLKPVEEKYKCGKCDKTHTRMVYKEVEG